MTVRDGVGVIRERWIIVLAITVLAVGGALAVCLVRPPEYTATIGFYVSAQNADNTQSAYQGGLLSQERVKSYVQLIESTRVAREVIADVGPPTSTPEQVAREITAASTADSVIIQVAVTDRSATRAAAIANSVGTRFTALVDEFERPARGTDSPVAVHVIQPAQVPSAPSTPGLVAMLALGLLGGVVLGIGAALARAMLDVTVKSVEQLRELASAPNLGSIAYDARVRRRPLTVHEGPQSPRAEAFRRLRTNLRFLDVDRAHRVVALTSAVPGEGKTTTVLNLAIAIAAGGQRVLVIDADLRRPCAARLLGMEGGIGLTSVLSGRIDPFAATQQWAERADLLASGPIPPNPSELLASRHLRRVLDAIRPHYDVVLIDTPPVLPVTDAAGLAPLTDGMIMVVRHGRTTADQVGAAVAAIDAVHVPVLGTVLTMVSGRRAHAYTHYNGVYPTEPAQPQPAEEALVERTVPVLRPAGRASASPPPAAERHGSRHDAGRHDRGRHTGARHNGARLTGAAPRTDA